MIAAAVAVAFLGVLLVATTVIPIVVDWLDRVDIFP